MSLQELVSGWNYFFHSPESTFGLAVFRCAFGLLIALNSLITLKHVKRHLAPDGIFNFERFERTYGRSRFTLLNILPTTTTSVHLLLVLMFAGGIFLSIGFFSQIAAAICFVTLVSIHHRNPAILNSGDTILRLMSFLLIFSAAGSGWSIDAWRRGEWEAEASPWCTRLMQLQLCLIYLHSVVCKIRGRRWRDGTAVWYPVHCKEYTRFPLPGLLLKNPFLQIATWGTLVMETLLGTAIWIDEFRHPLMVCGILFHLLLEYCLNIQIFGWIMIVCLLLFI